MDPARQVIEMSQPALSSHGAFGTAISWADPLHETPAQQTRYGHVTKELE
jgi:hypothetical protein